MKILGLSCSPRPSGNTATLVGEALNGARDEGVEAELFSLAGKEIKPCDGCLTCTETGKCHINDDMQTVYPKLMEADGFIFGTPIYYSTMASQAKALIDRCYCLRRPTNRLVNKVGGVIVVAGGGGVIDAVKDLYLYFANNHIVAADCVTASAAVEGAVKKNQLAMKAAWELGREMVQLVEKRFEFPSEFVHGPHFSNYVSWKYKL